MTAPHYSLTSASLRPKEFKSLLDKYYPILRRIGRTLWHLGIIPLIQDTERIRSSGNFSLRVGEGFLITATNADKGNLRRSDIVFVEKIDHSKHILFTRGRNRPSREVLIHELAYRSFSSISVIIHTHDMAVLLYGGIPTTPFYTVAADSEEAEKIVSLLHTSPSINMRGHGQIVIAPSVEEGLEIIMDNHLQAVERAKQKVKCGGEDSNLRRH